MNNESRVTTKKSSVPVSYWLGAISGVPLGFGLCNLTHDINRPAAAGTWDEYYEAQSAHSLREMQLEMERRNHEAEINRLRDPYRSPC